MGTIRPFTLKYTMISNANTPSEKPMWVSLTNSIKPICISLNDAKQDIRPQYGNLMNDPEMAGPPQLKGPNTVEYPDGTLVSKFPIPLNQPTYDELYISSTKTN